jgi:hypothetical protein
LWGRTPSQQKEIDMASRIIKHAVWLTLAVGATALAAGGPPPGKGGGGGETTAANNLSYPAVGDAVVTSNATATVPVGALGTSFSYGCAVPETIGTTTYPNTSCVSADGNTFYDADTCVSNQCSGQAVERIYWQKVTSNKWAAQTVTGAGFDAAFIDWGDNLETTSWTSSSVVRVETTPFADVTPTNQVGFQMWHVFGAGTNEQWGVHADGGQTSPYLYQYDSPYAVINTAGAYLNITKLESGATACQPLNKPPFSFSWDLVSSTWTDAPLTLYNAVNKAELAVSGKYVYGYNWNLKTAVVPTNINKAGWWRLTFYTKNREVALDGGTQLVPPVLPAATLRPQPQPQQSAASTDIVPMADTGPLFTPVIDVPNNLTYIDICLTAGKGGGGGKGGGKGGGGGKPPGAGEGE